MSKRLRTVIFGIGLMILLAQPAFAEELGQANITPRTKMAEIRSNPSIVGAGIYTYSLDQDRVLDRMYWDAQPLSRLSNHWTAQDAADGLNYLIRTYNAGQRVTFRFIRRRRSRRIPAGTVWNCIICRQKGRRRTRNMRW